MFYDENKLKFNLGFNYHSLDYIIFHFLNFQISYVFISLITNKHQINIFGIIALSCKGVEVTDIAVIGIYPDADIDVILIMMHMIHCNLGTGKSWSRRKVIFLFHIQ